jgi:hypothetical protein
VGVRSIHPDHDESAAPGRELLINTRETIVPFDAEGWLRRWQANGNAAELMPDGRMWLTYGHRGSRPRRDALELELRRGGVEAVKVWLGGRSP